MFRRIHIPDIYLTKLYFVRICLINSHGGCVHYSLGFANAIPRLIIDYMLASEISSRTPGSASQTYRVDYFVCFMDFDI